MRGETAVALGIGVVDAATDAWRSFDPAFQQFTPTGA
jgi:hypothetical protein